MWALINVTPLAAERAFLRDRRGGEVWIVMVGATCEIGLDGSAALADEQLPVRLQPEYASEPGASPLVRDTDLVLTKATTDILVLGNAYAPQGKAVDELSVGLAVGELRKTLWVHGDSAWIEPALGVTTSPTPFETMPLTYERAYGGVDPNDPDKWLADNPIGRGYAATDRRKVGLRAPNITYGRDQATRVAGFGPVDPRWPSRAKLAGTYDEQWEAERMPLPPTDFDDAYYQSAPLDQRSAKPLRGGEPVAITNMHPDGPLNFKLPLLRPVFRTRIADEIVVHEGSMHSVIIEPDQQRLQMIWHASMPCHGRLQHLDSTHIDLKRVV
ncbi:MAG: DUF2169 domain-containing protein [Deltaproteobacteria bacterium]|nr:DUF2169 domain-containing protein [Deltaproteobacteria bacterium]